MRAIRGSNSDPHNSNHNIRNSSRIHSSQNPVIVVRKCNSKIESQERPTSPPPRITRSVCIGSIGFWSLVSYWATCDEIAKGVTNEVSSCERAKGV